ncbi:hypothetical protein I3842_07G146900 [Carya illinoinensis]|uniref:Uncharacterized protein n=1 Tax=Carya illinoinensis TaxID=32201 RepID=A0A922EMG7_CARIL|nr:hypothetical protein I3842_07G146900 [Carya illinoinensis]
MYNPRKAAQQFCHIVLSCNARHLAEVPYARATKDRVHGPHSTPDVSSFNAVTISMEVLFSWIPTLCVHDHDSCHEAFRT